MVKTNLLMKVNQMKIFCIIKLRKLLVENETNVDIIKNSIVTMLDSYEKKFKTDEKYLNSSISSQCCEDIIEKQLNEKAQEKLKNQIDDVCLKLKEYEKALENKDKLMLLKNAEIEKLNYMIIEKNKINLQTVKELEQCRSDEYLKFHKNLDKIQKCCEILKSKNIDLKEENSILYVENNKLKEDYDKLRDDLNEAITTLHNQSSIVSFSVQDVEKMDKIMYDFNQLKINYSEVKEKCLDLQNMNDKLQEDLENANSCTKSIADKVRDEVSEMMSTEINTLKDENKRLKNEIESLQQDKTKLCDDLEKLISDNNDSTIKFDDYNKLSENNCLLQKTLNEVQCEKEKIINDNITLNQQLQSHISLIQQTENRWSELKEAYLKDKDRSSLMEKLINELKNSNGQLNNENLELYTEIKTLKENSMESSNIEVNNLSEENKNLKDQLSHLEKILENIQMKNEFNNKNYNLNEKVQHLISVKEENVKLQKIINEHTQVVENYNSQIIDMCATIEQLQTNQTNTVELSMLKQQYNEKIYELEAHISKLENQLDSIIKEKNTYLKERLNLLNNIEEKKLNLAELNSNITSVKEELNTILNENEHFSNKHLSLVTTITEKETNIYNLCNNIDELKNQLNITEKENKKLTENRLVLETNFNEKEIQLTKLNETLKQYENTISEMEENYNILKNENLVLTDKLNYTSVSDLEQQNKTLKDRFQKQKHLLISKVKVLKEFEITCQNLKQQVVLLTEELENMRMLQFNQSLKDNSRENSTSILKKCEKELEECYEILICKFNELNLVNRKQNHEIYFLNCVFQSLKDLFDNSFDNVSQQVLRQLLIQYPHTDDALQNNLENFFFSFINYLETSNNFKNDTNVGVDDVKLIAQKEVDKLIHEAVEKAKISKTNEFELKEQQRLKDQLEILKQENEFLKQRYDEYNNKICSYNISDTNDSSTQTIVNLDTVISQNNIVNDQHKIDSKHNLTYSTEEDEIDIKSLQHRYNNLKTKYKQLRTQKVNDDDNRTESTNLNEILRKLNEELKKEKEKYDALQKRYVQDNETHVEDLSQCQSELDNLMCEKLETNKHLAVVEEKYQILKNDYDQLKSCSLEFQNIKINNSITMSSDNDKFDEIVNTSSNEKELLNNELIKKTITTPLSSTLLTDSNLKTKEENPELQLRSIAERDRLIEFLSEKIQKLEWEHYNKNSKYNEDSSILIKDQLDKALVAVHERDVRCDELTLELTRLLEERDTLQLRLSNALKQVQLFDEEQKILPKFHQPNINNKIDELRELQYKKDYDLCADQERRHVSQMQLLCQDKNSSATNANQTLSHSINSSTGGSSSNNSSSHSWFKDILW
ncbi:interaptin-like isoform X2 [Daktulosphaira vitifoliae]|uniref:interaptin-like isoform X2 n=1 Tax=Daktulosphaira vitifoliae TaxID=58002 RepID=UPI0021A9BD35|nr:interaptin-like isoform X2 [Daktulosphaira vitifoliae]